MTGTARYLDYLFRDCGIVELRHLPSKRSGWYNNPEALLRDARVLAQTGNVFTSLNRPVSREVANQVTGKALKDAEVERITRIFFDFDAVRPKSTSSTDAELALASEAANVLVQSLSAMGWPQPAFGMSGNGAHLQYRCVLPNDDATRQLLGTIYTGLKRDYSAWQVDFDTTVRNPARICTLYGSRKRKGESTRERPHRQSRIEIPREWRQIRQKHLEWVAHFYNQQQPERPVRQSAPVTFDGRGDYNTLDIVAWFTAHGHYRRPIGDYNGSPKHAVRCPFSHEHTTVLPDHEDTSTIILDNADGWPGFICKHSHCEQRTVRDVMNLWGDADQFCTTTFQRLESGSE